MDEIREQLDKEISRIFENQIFLKPETEEYSTAVDNLAKMCKIRLDLIKADQDYQEKLHHRKIEEQQLMIQEKVDLVNLMNDKNLKERQIREQIKDRCVKVGLEAVSVILPLMFYGVWMKRGFRFEETGTFTSATFRGLFSKFKPVK